MVAPCGTRPAWYAAGVGRVKFRNYEGRVHVLLKFTPGKAK